MMSKKVSLLVKIVFICFFIISFINCLDGLTYSQTKKEKKSSIHPFFFLYFLNSQVAPVSNQSTVPKLNFTLSSATTGSMFLATAYNSSGKRIAGIVGTIPESKSFSGNWKGIDESKGLVTTADSAEWKDTKYYIEVYVDANNSKTLTLTDDKVSYLVSPNPEGGSISSINLTETSFTQSHNINISYSTNDSYLSSYLNKDVNCYMQIPDFPISLSSASKIGELFFTHTVAASYGRILDANSFTTEIGPYEIDFTKRILPRYIASDMVGDAICYIDNNDNDWPDTGEPYFRATSVTLTSFTVTRIGNLE